MKKKVTIVMSKNEGAKVNIIQTTKYTLFSFGT